ncbi:glutamine amidotransferase [Acinetobacter larvae]|uniref:Glutamine amidotransferase n=1 Tax=Acinetobacter larvae TaxID=1789224 RepID=A0A1B2M3H6_9GAMM|nr:glutamine amidotransferase [Acinetobacter larvae]AOA59755.1 glutamine amidotransferase [Acinetobacter larvae]
MKKVYAIQTLAFEDLGSFAATLMELGYEIHYLQLGVDALQPALASTHPVILLGGPISVYDQVNYPYVSDLIAALQSRLRANLPTLGICLGAQFIAAALGAKVYAGHVKEIGWSRLSINNQGFNSPLRYLDDVAVLHWHGDTFDIPTAAKRLAGSIYYPNQAFAVGLNILALQFHVELDLKQIESWLIGHHHELHNAQIDILTLRQDSLRYGKALQDQAQRLLRDWIGNLIPVPTQRIE